MEIKLPHLGDGVKTATVLSILVSVGDKVAKEQTLMELETDKAVAPIPSPAAGVVDQIIVKEGATVSQGTLVMIFKAGGGDSAPVAAAHVAVSAPVPATSVAQPSSVVAHPIVGTHVVNSLENIVTSPAIREAALRYGIDLTRVQGTGNGGRITTEDVRAYILSLQALSLSGNVSSASSAPVVKPLEIDFSKWGRVREESVSSLRQKIGAKMAESWTTVPHVTQFDEACIDHVMGLRKKYNPEFQKKNARLTVTVFALKAVVSALKKFPTFNASYDEANGKLIVKDYYHIGVAVDTPAGLIVPVIRDVDKKSVLELSQELEVIAAKARDRKIGLDDLQGGTFTISNLGSLGVGAFTPIVNTPEVAILGLSKGSVRPVFDEKGKVVPKLMMPVSLSYDHRVIDGADGARFVRELIHDIESFDEKGML
jgi:pyruvate dehydrogenase E2 component (dihydrolipoamide acetyltransferase)